MSTTDPVNTPFPTSSVSPAAPATPELIEDLADAAGDSIGRALHAAGDSLGRCARDVCELGDEWAENVRETVRERPLTAVVTALAIGVLLARLSR